MEQATINGAELTYDVTGSGDPVLLISTGPIADSFSPLVRERAMADGYRSIQYRQRRMDGDTHGTAPVSFAQHAADAAALLRHLGVRRAHVAGHSTGAAIALQLAVDHPEVVHTLALLEAPLVSAPGAADFFEKAGPALDAYGSGDRAGAMRAFLGVVSGLGWEACRALLEKHVPGGVEWAIANAGNFFGSYLPALEAWRFGPGEAAAISTPVLAVLGTETDRWFADSNELLHSLLSQAQVEDCRIDGVAHLLHMQRPAPVARGMAEFFARHPIAGERRGARRAGLGARRADTPGTTGLEPSHVMSPIASA